MSKLDELIASAGHKVVDQSQTGSPKPDMPDTPKPPDTPAPAPETPTPPAPDTPKPAEPTPPPPTVDRLSILNETFGQEFKTEDEFKTWKDTVTGSVAKLTEYEQQVAALQQEKEELSKSFDPMSLFASKELFTLNGLLKKFPDKNPVILSEISTKDFSKSYLESPVDVLTLNLMLENPGVYSNKADAEEDVLTKYEVDDPAEIDPKAKRRMQVDAKVVVDKFNEFKNQIEIPAQVDLTAEKQKKTDADNAKRKALEDATAPLFTKSIPDSLKEVEFPIIVKGEDGTDVTEIAFKYEVGESYAKSKMVQDVLASVRESAIREGTDWTPQREAKLKSEVTDLLMANYLYHNRSKVYAALRDDLFAKFSDDAWMKRHNVRPLRQDGTTPKPDEAAESLARKQNDFLRKQGIKVS